MTCNELLERCRAFTLECLPSRDEVTREAVAERIFDNFKFLVGKS